MSTIEKTFSKDARYPRKKVGFAKFNQLANPIPGEITDPEEIKNTFKSYPFIPYASVDANTSSMGLLMWLNSLSKLSPTHGACIKSIKTYAFGDSLDITKKKSASFSLKEELSEVQKMSFIDWLDNTLRFNFNSSLHKEVTNAYEVFQSNGNIFVRVVLSNLFGIPSASVKVLKTEHVCYTTPRSKTRRFVGISPNWGIDYITKYPPEILPVYPAVKQSKDGTIETIIHISEDSTQLYGRPDWIGSFIPIYREFQDGNYLVVQAGNNFTGQTLIEIEEAEAGDGANLLDDDDAQKDGYDSALDRFTDQFTAKSDDPQTVILMSRPHGAGEAFVYQFKPNTSQDFYRTMSELDELDIIRAHQWSKRFLGENQTQGFSKDVFMDELKVKEAGVLPYYRRIACSPFNIAIDLMVKVFNKPEFQGYMITGQNNIEILKQFIPDEDIANGIRTEEGDVDQSGVSN